MLGEVLQSMQNIEASQPAGGYSHATLDDLDGKIEKLLLRQDEQGRVFSERFDFAITHRNNLHEQVMFELDRIERRSRGWTGQDVQGLQSLQAEPVPEPSEERKASLIRQLIRELRAEGVKEFHLSFPTD
jgi:hypothetical protein